MAGTSRRPGACAEIEAIAKPGGGVRWITYLPPDVDRTYRRLVGPLVGRIERSLGPGVAGNRARDATSSPIGLGRSRRRWRRALARSLQPGTWAVLSDVRECYASIGPVALRAGLGRVDGGASDGLEVFLRGMPMPGLPVGPDPSAILANAVLAIADDAAAATGVAVIRWVDDVVLAGTDRAVVLAAFDAWRAALGWLGLRPHEGKTRLVVDAERARTVLLGTPGSGVGGSMRGIIRSP